jgi:hypothetical protein
MPYELAFAKQLESVDRDRYINECCVGGDLVADALLPALQEKWGALSAIEEDWGWFIWFEQAGVKLAVDIFCDNPDTGDFRIHLTSRVRRFLGTKVVDTPELYVLKNIVVDSIATWIGKLPSVTLLDATHLPVENATST